MKTDALFRYWLMRICQLDANRRAELSATLNDWKWPDEFSDKKPTGWEDMEARYKFEIPTYRALVDAVRHTVSEFDISRAWWRYAVKEKTTHQHFEFYLQCHLGVKKPALPLLLTA